MDCYKCKYRGDALGSTHSRCNILKLGDNEYSDLLEIYIASGKYSIINESTKEPLVKLNEHGVKNGWALWPINFDPIWVESCNFYTEKI
jgi:hypothetical protein